VVWAATVNGPPEVYTLQARRDALAAAARLL
jgi:hypothetical protein